jgi:DNA-binding NarL/FixJ family response regulator
MEFPAVRLFVTRAEATTGRFAIDDSNATATIGICARLEGIPLALELAAARIRHLPPAALLAKLDHRLPLSAGSTRDLPARHRTLRHAIAWSHDLLDPAQRALFRRLAVFLNGWTLDAAEFLSNAGEPIEQDIFDLHSSLVDASLIRQSLSPAAGNHTEARFDMLETIREYGLEQLSGSGEQDAIRQAHAAYFLSLAEQARRDLIGPAHGTWIARLSVEHDNLRTAIASTIAGEDADSALRLGSALWQYWAERGHLQEGRAWLEQALAIDQEVMPSVRGDAFHVLGNLSLDLNDYERASRWFEEGLRIWRMLGDDDGAAVELTGLGLVARHRGNYDLAKTYFLECLAIFRGTGASVKVAATLHNLGNVAVAEGSFDQARTLHGEALELRKDLRDKGGIAYSLLELALVDQGLGDHAAAAARLEKSLALFLEVGNKQGEAFARDGLGKSALRQGDDRAGTVQLLASIALRQDIGDHFGIAECLEALAEVASRRGDGVRAARLLGASAVIFEAVGQVQPTADRVARDRLQVIARQSLGREAFNRAYNAGRELSLELAVAEAMTLGADVESTPHEALRFGLSAREIEVLRLLTQRMTDPEIARALFISPRTASSHVASILRKLQVDNRRDAAAFADRIGLTSR